MTPQELKNSILQLAIQGKLVEQRPEEGVAEVPAAPKHGGREARRHGEIEPPFDIPESWRWVHLGDLFDIARGGSPRPIKAFLTTDENGLNWIKIGDTEKNSKYINSCREKIIPAGLSKTRRVFKGDLLLTNSMSFGRPYILNIDGCIHDGWLVLHPADHQIFKDFFFYLLSSPVVFAQFQTAAAGAVVQNLNSEKVAQTLIPLPPLAEQKRIVSKIEELLPLLARYEQAWTKLEAFNTRFPSDLQKSLLQLAIQGKLVEQRPEEGNAETLFRQIQSEKHRLVLSGKIKKEKSLPEITEDEIPFDIPESWKWVRLCDICTIQTGKKDANFGSTTGKYFFFTCAKTPIRCDSFSFSGEAILMAGNGDFGNISYYAGDFEAYQRTYVLQPYIEFSYLKYVLYHLLCNWVAYNQDKTFGTAIPYIRLGNVQNYLVAFPPLAEQKRIITRLEELLPLCERLK